MAEFFQGAHDASKHQLVVTEAAGSTVVTTVVSPNAAIFVGPAFPGPVHQSEIYTALQDCMDTCRENGIAIGGGDIGGASVVPGSGLPVFSANIPTLPDTVVAVVYHTDFAGVASSSELLDALFTRMREWWLEQTGKVN